MSTWLSFFRCAHFTSRWPRTTDEWWSFHTNIMQNHSNLAKTLHVIYAVVGASLHLAPSSHYFLSFKGPCQIVSQGLSCWRCVVLPPLSLVLYSYLGLFWQLLCVLWHAHTTLNSKLCCGQKIFLQKACLGLWLCSVLSFYGYDIR